MTGTAIRIIASCFAAALLGGCTTLVPPPAVQTLSADKAIGAWAGVLSRFVDERGAVDFAALALDRAELDQYLRFVADTPIDRFANTNEQLAHLINAYNALSMFNVLESGIPRTHAGWHKLTFFVRRKLTIGGQTMSLYRFENDVIRPLTRSLADARVHFALNCSALSCPALPRVPFSGPTLDAQLNRESRSFFARPENFRVDPIRRAVWLSEIMKFYADDFVPSQGRNLIDYANRFSPQPAPLDYEVYFTPYDWTVANSRRTAGINETPSPRTGRIDATHPDI